MYQYGFRSFGDGYHPLFGIAFGLLAGFLVLAVIWTLVWKALALWKAARSGNKWWFVVLLLVNTLGVLEILYIYVFSKRKMKDIMKPAHPVT